MKIYIKALVIVILGILIFQNPSVLAQKVNVKVNGQKIKNIITYISADDKLGRKPNTPEFFELQDWLVRQYEEWGLEPAGDDGTFFQSVPIERNYAVNYGMPKLTINNREFFARYEDFRIDSRSTPGVEIEQNIVFAGYGISAPEKGLDEYADINVEEKIILVIKGNPNDFTPPRQRMASTIKDADKAEEKLEDWSKETTDSTKIITAFHKGAVAIIFYDPENKLSSMSRYRPNLKKFPFGRDFIIISKVKEEVFNWILWTDEQMSGRSFKTWFNGVRTDIRNKKARSFDTKFVAEIAGFKNTLIKGKEFNDYKGRNIIAKVSGTDPELKNQYVVIGAHFDHLGVTNGQIYNGAEDNGTGSGVLIELARLLKEHNIQTKRTLLLCLWTAEELGLIGSRYWVENPTDGVRMDQVVTYFNMDMVGIGADLAAPGALNFPTIWEVIKRDQDQDVLDALKPRKGGPGGSDHSAFITLGIEALALMTGGPEGHPDYHDTGDDAYKLDPETLRKTGQFILQGAVNLGNETTVQLLIPKREQIFLGTSWSLVVINPDIEIVIDNQRERMMRGNWKRLKVKSSVDLNKLMMDKIKELKKPKKDDNPFAAMRRRFGSVTRRDGILGAEVFNYDVNIMKLAKEILNFGRLDIQGDDGIWFDQGLTEKGIKALKEMRKKKIALHLMNPTKATLLAVLDKSRKSFLITGFSDYNDDLLERIKKRKALIGVDFDPNDVEGCVAQLEMFKIKFDTTANLILNVTSGEGLDEAKQELYMQLIKKGWEKKEIYAIGGAALSRREKNNLDVLPGGRPSFRMP